VPLSAGDDRDVAARVSCIHVRAVRLNSSISICFTLYFVEVSYKQLLQVAPSTTISQEFTDSRCQRHFAS